MKKINAALLLFVITTSLHAQDTKMNSFITNLMGKMTIDEKIGQLNLVTPGGAVTGSVVSSDVDNKIRKGDVGGLFGITGADKIRKAQEIAVNNSRLHIPLLFGLDVIHGHRTIFPIPHGLNAVHTLRQQKQLQKACAGHFHQWLILPVIRAGGALQKVPAKILFL